MKIQINDCTIRDGGYLLNKNSPDDFVQGVIDGLISSGIDIIENGFLQNKSENETLVYKNSVDARKFVSNPSYAARMTGFCDNSRYSLENLDEYDGQAFDYLKISFAKHESDDALNFVSGAIKKGYKVLANPMDAQSYTTSERSLMIERINKIKPYAFSIVDTFGTLYLKDLKEIFTQMDQELDKAISIGLHSHNNLHLSNALAEAMIDMAIRSDRGIIVDSSLYGMGRGAGNASTEVLANYINKVNNSKVYDMGRLFETIEKFILPLRAKVTWGYDLPMFVCGMEGAHVDNIFYLNKNMNCSSKDILDIISSLDVSKRKRYGANYSKTDFSDLEKACERFHVYKK